MARPFSPLCPPDWAATALSFVKEMDIINSAKKPFLGRSFSSRKSRKISRRSNPGTQRSQSKVILEGDVEQDVPTSLLSLSGFWCPRHARDTFLCREKQPSEKDLLPGETKAASSPSSRLWRMMQTFSFSRWASSLGSFGIFLRSTLTAQRLHPCTSSTALIPLPIPKLGIFEQRRCGSKERRKRSFDQAFHICVMAFNFWHANFKHVPIESLSRELSPPQLEALRNLRNTLKSFGSSEEEFSVPKSGRRVTSLFSTLADLSHIVTWEGLGGDTYSRAFQGSPTGVDAFVSAPSRSLDSARLQLLGKAARLQLQRHKSFPAVEHAICWDEKI